MMKKITITFLLAVAMFASPLAAAEPLEPRLVAGGAEFSYKADAKSGKVAVAGEFNGWDPAKNFLKFDEKRGLWSTVLPLGEGKYEYKFVIDGEWMDGPNLTLELAKKDGRLPALRRSAGTANTPYSGKINFSGRFVSEVGVVREGAESDYSSSRPLNHLDMDWSAAVSGDIRAFARMEYESSASGEGGFILKQSSLKFGGDNAGAEAAYKKKIVQFDDPLKITAREVSLKYSAPEFFDETNPHKAFGLWEQTAVIYGSFLDGRASVRAFFSDMSRPATHFHAIEDNYGWRATYLFAGAPLKAGLTARHTRGGWWPWANTDNHWFPDPETAVGYSADSATRGTASVWYRGYTQSDFMSADSAFYFLPWLSIFGEAASVSRRLQTEKISGDISRQKTWEYLKETAVTGGGKFFTSDDLSFEIRAKKTDVEVIPPLSAIPETETSGARVAVSARWRGGNMSASLSASSDENGILGRNIPLDLHPWARNLFAPGFFPYEYHAAGGRFVRAVVKDVSLSPAIRYDSVRVSAGAVSRLRILEVMPNFASDGATYAAADGAETVKTAETLLDVSAAIYGNWRAETSARFSTWDTPDGGYRNFASVFAALKYVFLKDSYVRFGWGIDPEGTDDDILADFDRREVFLYNRSASGGDILSSEEALAAVSAVSLRAVLKW